MEMSVLCVSELSLRRFKGLCSGIVVFIESWIVLFFKNRLFV